MQLRSSCARAGILDPANQIGRSGRPARSLTGTDAPIWRYHHGALDVLAQMIGAHVLARSASPECARDQADLVRWTDWERAFA